MCPSIGHIWCSTSSVRKLRVHEYIVNKRAGLSHNTDTLQCTVYMYVHVHAPDTVEPLTVKLMGEGAQVTSTSTGFPLGNSAHLPHPTSPFGSVTVFPSVRGSEGGGGGDTGGVMGAEETGGGDLVSGGEREEEVGGEGLGADGGAAKWPDSTSGALPGTGDGAYGTPSLIHTFGESTSESLVISAATGDC